MQATDGRDIVDAELVERAATLLRVLPGVPRRDTIEHLLAADDPYRARRAVDALIETAFAAEDEAGRLRITHGPDAARAPHEADGTSNG